MAGSLTLACLRNASEGANFLCSFSSASSLSCCCPGLPSSMFCSLHRTINDERGNDERDRHPVHHSLFIVPCTPRQATRQRASPGAGDPTRRIAPPPPLVVAGSRDWP